MAIDWYRAVPAMLIVAASGITRLAEPGRTPSFDTAVSIETGITAAVLEVEKAMSCTEAIEAANLPTLNPDMVAIMARNSRYSSASPISTAPA